MKVAITVLLVAVIAVVVLVSAVAAHTSASGWTATNRQTCAIAKLVIYEAQSEGTRSEYEHKLLAEAGC